MKSLKGQEIPYNIRRLTIKTRVFIIKNNDKFNKTYDYLLLYNVFEDELNLNRRQLK